MTMKCRICFSRRTPKNKLHQMEPKYRIQFKVGTCRWQSRFFFSFALFIARFSLNKRFSSECARCSRCNFIARIAYRNSFRRFHVLITSISSTMHIDFRSFSNLPIAFYDNFSRQSQIASVRYLLFTGLGEFRTITHYPFIV